MLQGVFRNVLEGNLIRVSSHLYMRANEVPTHITQNPKTTHNKIQDIKTTRKLLGFPV